MTALVDRDARRRIRDDLDRTFVVEAAAGTGKTTALVSRIVALVRTGQAELQSIIAVTFTEAAAGEMKLRIRAELERTRTVTTDAERARLDRALAQLEEARISTIHGLCIDLLRERPVEAAIDPLFQVAAEDETRRLFDQAFDFWFQRILEDPPPGVRRVLRRRRRGRDSSPREELRSAGFQLLEHRDFATAWRRDPFDRDAAIEQVLALLEQEAPLADAADRRDDKVRIIFTVIQSFLAELHRREALAGRDYDALEAELGELARHGDWFWRYGGQWYQKGKITRAEIVDRKDRLQAALQAFCELANADLAALLHQELLPLVADYEALKSRTGKLDFLDLLLRTRDLVRDNAAVRADLQRRVSHVFVDEFQDTDPLQAEILLLLSSRDPSTSDWLSVVPAPGKLFLVGDPKQSIYRFRRADVALYEQIKRRLVDQGAEVLHLVSSFRGAPDIQHAVNAAFALRMEPNELGTQAAYVPLMPVRDPIAERPSVIALPVPRPYGDRGKVTNVAIDESLPDAVGAFVDWLVTQSGWQVTEREDPSRRVPVSARHVCLLFKRLQNYRNDTTRAYVRALEARGIPHVLVGGRSFHQREEIVALRSVLTAIEWPDDDLAVFATLRGPFFALGDDALLAFSAARGGSGAFHPMRPIDGALTELTQPVADALVFLAELHRSRNRRPIADTIGRFLEATRAHAGVAIWPTGEQALANVMRLIDIARRFESAGATSFRAFVESLEDAAERGAGGEAPVLEEGTDGVRIMTVHKAKGLEFPVVILVDPTAPIAHRDPSHHVDHARRLWVERLAGCAPVELIENRDDVLRREREEGVRLAYVAATRARDLLVIPVVGDEKRSGWVDVLHPALYPHPQTRHQPRESPGCPGFGNDSVLERHVDAHDRFEQAVAPGTHVPEHGEHRVTWWDPSVLGLDRAFDLGLRQQAMLTGDDTDVTAETTARDHAAWQARRRARIEKGARPTLVGASATAASRDPSIAIPGATIEHQRVPGDRGGHPRGKRFGALVHAVLAAVPLDRDVPLDAVTEAHGRLLGATSDEIAAARVRVERALHHPLMARAREAAALGRCRREVAIAARVDDIVVDGVVDLAFRDSSAWTVVDFKTDVELDPERARAYEAQVRVYVAAIERATGETAQGILLSV